MGGGAFKTRLLYVECLGGVQIKKLLGLCIFGKSIIVCHIDYRSSTGTHAEESRLYYLYAKV